MNLCSSTRSVLHADRDRERTPVEQAPEQAQSRRGLFQDLRPDRVTASVLVNCNGRSHSVMVYILTRAIIVRVSFAER